MKRKLKRLFNTNKTRVIIYLFISIFFLIAAIWTTISIVKLNGIETGFRIIILVLIYLFFFYYLYKGYVYIIDKKKVKYFILSIVAFLIAVILGIITYYINVVYGSINLISSKDTNYYTGYLITLNDTSKIEKVGIINNTLDIEGYKIANELIQENKLKYDLVKYETYEDMLYDLYNKEIDGAFVQGNYATYFSSEEEYKNIKNETKIIYKKTIKEKNNNSNVTSDKTLKEPFTILLMGVDSTENTIESANSFNGDTLMLITFNPKTLNAIMFSIPRDLFVPIACRNNAEAKINTSSTGGINCVMDTIENLTTIKVDYYARINFKGVVDLVEALKGIDVNVTASFCEQDSNRDFSNEICLKEGYQHLNGEEALAYARHRHTLPTGDLQRIQNQQLIVEAISRKLLSLNTVTDFKEILSSISKNITTNLTVDQILSSYNILKQMVLNVISEKDPLAVEKAYLEVYDKTVYYEKRGTYSSALGYYEKSLNSIIEALNVNLEKEKPQIIKEFSFDANTPYEQKLIGKGDRNAVDNPVIGNFIGKTVEDAKEWGEANGIEIVVEFVNVGDANYNEGVSVGLIGAQSIKAGASTYNVSSMTVYVNGSGDSKEEEDTTEPNDEEMEID